MTSVYALSRVHYGIDYLCPVIQSLQPFVREHLILYTATPTFGRYTSMPNPDSREAVMAAAQAAVNGGATVRWVENAPIEVTTAINYYPDADIVIEADADEVYDAALVDDIIRQYEAGNLTAYAYRLPFRHFWRSFDYACEDGQHPIRVYLPKAANRNTDHYPTPPNGAKVNHFGYCRTRVDMAYKWETSVHIGELRPEWWSEIWGKFPERLTDLHPVSFNMWNAQSFDKATLPPFMREHPYYGLEVVE